jgi:hemerythrin
LGINWTNEFSVGIDELDLHHRHLFSLINRLYELNRNREDERQIEDILADLREYTSYHFRTEEELFRKCEYPFAGEHIEEHDHFSERLRNISEMVGRDEESAILALMDALSSWLTGHIMNTDKKYIPYLKNQS